MSTCLPTRHQAPPITQQAAGKEPPAAQISNPVASASRAFGLLWQRKNLPSWGWWPATPGAGGAEERAGDGCSATTVRPTPVKRISKNPVILGLLFPAAQLFLGELALCKCTHQTFPTVAQ